MTVLDGPAETPAQAYKAASQIRCPECLREFSPVHPSQIFCSTPHKKAFNNRQISRGVSLTPLVIAARITRGGTQGDTITGKKARGDAEALIQRWVREDRAEGRMSMVEYVAIRYRKGFVQT